jgi:signal transduction histidine kinase
MTQGDFIRKPDQRVKLLLTTQVVWATALIVLALWWGTLLHKQGDEIAALQTQLGVSEPAVQTRLDRTERMINGESGTFVFLILAANGVLLYFFMRDAKRSKSLHAFFASFTHELRTPLTSIKLQAEALKDITNDAKQSPFLTRLLEDTERLENQVQRSLELARLEGGGKLSLQSIQIKPFIQNKLIPLYAYSDKKIQINCELSDGIIRADTTALTMVFRNIVDNALKYSTEFPTRLKIWGEKNSPFYFIHVTHENSQFDGETKNLGQLFYRGKNSQGAGVGLYLINTLTQKMNGIAEFSTREKGKFATNLTLHLDPTDLKPNQKGEA